MPTLTSILRVTMMLAGLGVGLRAGFVIPWKWASRLPGFSAGVAVGGIASILGGAMLAEVVAGRVGGFMGMSFGVPIGVFLGTLIGSMTLNFLAGALGVTVAQVARRRR